MALSQEQINAILEGTGTYDAAPAAATENTGLEAREREFFGGFAQIAMESGAAAVSQALGKTVEVSHPDLSVVQASQVRQELGGDQILIRTGYLTDREYESLLLIKDYDVAVIFDILMGKDGRNPDLEMGDLQISAIGEVMNQLVGAAATGLSKEFEIKIAMIPPDSQAWARDALLPQAYQNVPLLQTRYQLIIEGVLDSEFFELRSLDSARQLYRALTHQNTPAPPAPQPAAPSFGAAPAAHAGPSSYAQSPAQPAGGYAAPVASQPPPSVRPVEFAPLMPTSTAAGNANLDRIMDIPLRLTVELGSTRLKVKSVVDLTKGSIVELDKLAGEPVDLLVNGRLMAKGEVVVINENFGVRITEIMGPADRLQHLSGS
ncbi:MAG: flagellar motor switch phosphatase FliY [Candidatus Sericytochromatia bacterium]